MKIKDAQVGQSVVITLLVKAAEIKLTRNNKPYLFVTLTDGTEELQGQDWDYGDRTPPAKNTVLEVTGDISEYMGKKQIKIKKFVESDLGVELFAPSGDVNVGEYTEMLKHYIDMIGNPYTRVLVRNVFNDNITALKTLPAAKGMHHAFVHGLIKHIVDVTRKAKVLAEMTPMANIDLVIAGALLHDMGKFRTYVLNGAIIDMTDEGQLIEHIMLGAMMLDKYRTEDNTKIVDLILHIISSHHGKLEYGSPTTPRCIEAVIVNYADGVDAKCQMLIEQNQKTLDGATWTDKVWAMDNRPMLTQKHIQEIMAW